MVANQSATDSVITWPQSQHCTVQIQPETPHLWVHETVGGHPDTAVTLGDLTRPCFKKGWGYSAVIGKVLAWHTWDPGFSLQYYTSTHTGTQAHTQRTELLITPSRNSVPTKQWVPQPNLWKPLASLCLCTYAKWLVAAESHRFPICIWRTLLGTVFPEFIFAGVYE